MADNTRNAPAFLGRGLGFPPAIDPGTGDFQMVEGDADVQQSIEILLATMPRERVLSPSFGCNLHQMLFEPLTTTLITEMKDIVETALIMYEPRIMVNSVDIEPDPNQLGLVLIRIDYTVRSNNSRFNFVYPFYKEEGTNIQY